MAHKRCTYEDGLDKCTRILPKDWPVPFCEEHAGRQPRSGNPSDGRKVSPVVASIVGTGGVVGAIEVIRGWLKPKSVSGTVTVGIVVVAVVSYFVGKEIAESRRSATTSAEHKEKTVDSPVDRRSPRKNLDNDQLRDRRVTRPIIKELLSAKQERVTECLAGESETAVCYKPIGEYCPPVYRKRTCGGGSKWEPWGPCYPSGGNEVPYYPSTRNKQCNDEMCLRIFSVDKRSGVKGEVKNLTDGGFAGEAIGITVFDEDKNPVIVRPPESCQKMNVGIIYFTLPHQELDEKIEPGEVITLQVTALPCEKSNDEGYYKRGYKSTPIVSLSRCTYK